MEFSDELRIAKEAARKAGEVIKQYRREGFEVERKESRTDFVTEADREA